MTASPTDDLRLTTVYLCFNEQGRLLYVGIAGRAGVRWGQHAAGSPWWEETAYVKLVHCYGRDVAEHFERALISGCVPRYNRVHNRKIAHFNRWLRQHRGTASFLGDLAYDIALDREWPRTGKVCDLYRHVRDSTLWAPADDAIDTALLAWRAAEFADETSWVWESSFDTFEEWANVPSQEAIWTS